ncbi:DoxX family protein [Streptomyces exfoliatus]|uniref:DoxX family protein n=1 Tax=Streptomyces exfoliatus TaxID=1905 RepID=UPI000AEFDC2F|nr:hypothetical protein [Streptomyces exfoliatus]
MPTPARSALLLAGLLASAGVAHFVAPRQFDATVPRALPGSPRAWTAASGAVELALAAGLVVPATRRASAHATALFFAGVFPANVKMAYDSVAMAPPWRPSPPCEARHQTPLPDPA